MIDVENGVLPNKLKQQRDEILREAVRASNENVGRPDEYFIINFLIDRLIYSDKFLESLELPVD